MRSTRKRSPFVAVVSLAVALGIAGGARATLILEGDWTTPGAPIEIADNVILGTPPTITLSTTEGGSSGAPITISGTVDDDVAGSTHLIFRAGPDHEIAITAEVGGIIPPAGLTVDSASQIRLAAANVRGPIILLAPTPTVTILNGNLATNGGAITINGNVLLGAAANITLNTVGGGGGGNITLGGMIADDVANSSGLVLAAGTGTIDLMGTVGIGNAIGSLTINSAGQVNLPTVTTGGAVTVTATSLDVTGPMAAGGNVALNVTTASLDGLITAGGALTGFAGTVKVYASGSLQNAVAIAQAGATITAAASTYSETVNVDKAVTVDFDSGTTIDKTVTISAHGVEFGGTAEWLSVAGLSIDEPSSLDIGSLVLYVDKNVASTLDGWISDGRLMSSTWPTLVAAYDEPNDRTVVTPEPATLALLALGGLMVRLRRRK